MTIFCCSLTWQKGHRSSQAASVGTLILIMRALPLRSNHLWKDPSPNTIVLGVRISTDEFWGDTNIQTIAILMTFFKKNFSALKLTIFINSLSYYDHYFSFPYIKLKLKNIPDPRVIYVFSRNGKVRHYLLSDYYVTDSMLSPFLFPLISRSPLCVR